MARTVTDLLLFSVAALLLVPRAWLATAQEKDTPVSTQPAGNEPANGDIFATKFNEGNYKEKQSQNQQQKYPPQIKPEKEPCEDKTEYPQCPMPQAPCHIHLPPGCHLLTIMGCPFFPSMFGIHSPCKTECGKSENVVDGHKTGKEPGYAIKPEVTPKYQDPTPIKTVPEKNYAQKPTQGWDADRPISGPGAKNSYAVGKPQENPRYTSMPIEYIPPTPTGLQVRSGSDDEEEEQSGYGHLEYRNGGEGGRRYHKEPQYRPPKTWRPIYVEELKRYSSTVESDDTPHTRCRCVGVCSPTYENDNGEAVYPIGKRGSRR